MGIKISEMTPDSSVTGVELIPVSDAGVAKSVTVSNIKDFVVDQIEAITAGTSVDGDDSVFVMIDGVLKPVDIDLVAQHAIDTIWSKAAETSPDSADVMVLKDGGATEKTVTLALLAEYVRATVEASILDVSDLDAASSLATTDIFLVTQGTTAKKTTLASVNAAIYDGLNAYVTALSSVTVSADSDVLYVLQGGVEKKVTLTTIKTYLGISSVASAPAITTEDKVPQWSSTSKTLKEGLSVLTSVRASGSTSTDLVNESAVRAAVESLSDTIFSASAKTAPVSADSVMVIDSEDSDTPKLVTLENLLSSSSKFTSVYSTTSLTAYTLVLADAGKYMRFSNANPIAVTVPPNSSVAFETGAFLEVEQAGAGAITITAGSGVTVNAETGLVTDGQYSTIRLVKVDTDTWTAIGGVTGA